MTETTETPNHALQRTAPRVTVAAILACARPVRSWPCPTSAASFCAPPSQLPRHAPPSLSLGSLGDVSRFPPMTRLFVSLASLGAFARRGFRSFRAAPFSWTGRFGVQTLDPLSPAWALAHPDAAPLLNSEWSYPLRTALRTHAAAAACTPGFAAIAAFTAQPKPTPNHALQRTAPRVTLAAPRRPTAQPARRAPQSLSLASLGDFAHLLRVMSASEDIPSLMPPTKFHGLQKFSSESIASPTIWPSVASCRLRSGRFQSSQSGVASEFGSILARRLSRGSHVNTVHPQQLRASRQRGGFGLSSAACVSPSPSFPDIHVWASIASPSVTPGTLFGRLS